VNLESSHLNFILPDLIMKLDVVENGVHKSFNIWVLVTQEFKDNLDHLGLMQYNISRWFKEQEFKESVKDLLHHLVIFLLGTKEVLEHFNEIGFSYHYCDLFSPTNSRYKHHAF